MTVIQALILSYMEHDTSFLTCFPHLQSTPTLQQTQCHDFLNEQIPSLLKNLQQDPIACGINTLLCVGHKAPYNLILALLFRTLGIMLCELPF